MKRLVEYIRSKFRFREMQLVFLLFGLLVIVLYILQKNVSYGEAKRILEPYAVEAAAFKAEELPAECLLLWEEDEMGLLGREMMEAVLKQMRVPYISLEGKKENLQNLWEYRTVVLSMTHLNLLDEAILTLEKWVESGGKLMILYPPLVNGAFNLFAGDMGIQSAGNQMKYVDEMLLEDSILLSGGLERLSIPEPYESSLQVHLFPECVVHLWAQEKGTVPLIWTYENEYGRVVFGNLGHMDKAYRGFYCACYSLLEDYCVWPVINGSAFYIDDFPAPVSEGENEYIRRDYGMGISAFYKQIWWNDIYNLAKEYGLRYTGLAIEEYSNQVKAPFERQQNTRDYKYYGSVLLSQGGEIGLHGYNHMPLCLNYLGRRDPSLKNWESSEDMEKGLQELQSFLSFLFPDEEFHVYSPPANILSEEGREMLAAKFPDISAIASVYFPGETVYGQEFEVARDGIIETPRIISGYLFDEYDQLAAVSELNFHYVSSHFQHFNDVLSEENGAELGWEELSGRFSGYVNWLKEAAPGLRNLTGTEMAGAVQRYDSVKVHCEKETGELKIIIENFVDESWLMLRINDGKIGRVEGGSAQQVLGNMYLLKADASQMTVELQQ